MVPPFLHALKALCICRYNPLMPPGFWMPPPCVATFVLATPVASVGIGYPILVGHHVRPEGFEPSSPQRACGRPIQLGLRPIV